MKEEIKQHLSNQREPLREAIKGLVRFRSVIEEGGDGFPFGKGVDDVLRKTLKISERLGFRTKYGEGGYYGYAEVGHGEELIGVLGHLDVVPEGGLDTWDTGPFDPEEKEGKIFGRGTQDNKGPTLAALFAAKALMDAGIIFNKRLRFVFGTDEESLWRGMKRYLESEEKPSMGFTPDSKFPLIYAEKGLLEFHLEGRNKDGLGLTGGNAFNVVRLNEVPSANGSHGLRRAKQGDGSAGATAKRQFFIVSCEVDDLQEVLSYLGVHEYLSHGLLAGDELFCSDHWLELIHGVFPL